MTSTYDLPDQSGRYGRFGGRYVPETLMPAINELEESYRQVQTDDKFQAELSELLINFVGRPTELYFAPNLTERFGGAKIFLKREDSVSYTHLTLPTNREV